MSSEAPTESVAIEARGLGKTYAVYGRPEHRLWQLLFGRWRKFHRDFRAVHGVDLTVHRGETVGIVGRNGSGKSTLLQMVSGILTPTEGTLDVKGHIAPLLALGVGFEPEFTGRENVRMSAAMLGIPKDVLDETLDELIAFADLGEFFDQPVRVYSSGMAARLAFAVAIHADPEILVVDEILAVGDEAFARKCFARIDALKAKGSTILFVSHVSNLILELCDRAILMESGECVLTGDPKTVVSFYHKLLYAPIDARAEVLDEIRKVDAGEIPVTEEAAGEPSTPATDPDPARFDPGLRPSSTLEYASRGARICDPRVLDAEGRIVNVLSADHSYTYAYEVEFEQTALGVRFGMMVKLVTGFELAGQASHTWGRGLAVVEAGSLARVRFRIQPRLAPGAYFLNAGVLSLSDQGEFYLHRILDAVMFRVEANEASLATGVVNLSVTSGAEIEFEAPAAARLA